MKSKIVIVMCSIFLIGLLETCCNPDEILVKIVSVEVESSSSLIEDDEVYEFRILPLDSIIGFNKKMDLGLIQTAYGYDCEDTVAEILSEIESINVLSSNDFSSEYLASESLNKIIEVHRIDGRGGNQPTVNLDEFVSELNSEKYENLSRKAAVWNATYKITERPMINDNHIFEIELKTMNGELFHGVSQEIIWN